jgi:hypothetical protein
LSWAWQLTSVIPATWETEIRRFTVPGQPRQKVSKTSPQPINQAWWHIFMVPAMWEAEVGGSWSEASPGQKPESLPEKYLKQRKH